MKEAYHEKIVTMTTSGDHISKELAWELLWEAGGARHPEKALLVDINMDFVEHNNKDKWLGVDTKFDVDYIDATVSGRVAADLLWSYLGNHKVSHHQKLDGVDEKVLRATVGDNVVICMTHRDARAFQTFCWSNGGRLLPTCLNRGEPVKFFALTRKSIPDGVLREFLCRDGIFVRVVGYGMNMRLDERGLSVLKRLRLGKLECEARPFPTDWTDAMKDEYKEALWKPMHMDFSSVTPTNGVGKEEKEARLVLMKRIEGVAGRGYNQFHSEVYPVCGGDGINSGTVRLKKVRSR